MLLDNVFEPFIKEAPICVMARGVLQRILDPHHIDHLFTQTAQRQYTNELLFSSLVDLMTRVVIGQEPSVHAAYRKLEDQLPVSDQSVYNKLQHVELAVSAALVRDSARRIAPVIRALRASLPRSCPVTASSFSTATISRLRNIGLRNYARRGQPLCRASPWRSSTKNT